MGGLLSKTQSINDVNKTNKLLTFGTLTLMIPCFSKKNAVNCIFLAKERSTY
jgi:hypothetical protein